MEDISKLLEFGLTRNQAQLLKFFIDSYNNEERTNGWSFKDIDNQLSSKSHFYRELLTDLEEKGFLTVNRDSKPQIYYFNESRFEEIIQEKNKEYLRKQNALEKLLNKLNSKMLKKIDIKWLKDFLYQIKTVLKLKEEQILIYHSLFSQENGKLIPNSMTIKDIIQKIGNNNIRYNLNILLKKKYLEIKKIGRINFYSPKIITTILKNEIELQKKIWNNKKGRMQQTIYHFFKGQDTEYRFLSLGKNINFELKKVLESANQEILIDFRGNINRISEIYKFLKQFFIDLIEILNGSNIKAKIIFRSNAWIVNKIDATIIKLIELISKGKLEIREYIGNNERNIQIVIDDILTLQVIGEQTSTQFYKTLILKNKLRVHEIKFSYNYIWNKCVDFRHVILDYSINKELEENLEKSLKINPPIYNFGPEPFIISGVKMPIKIMMTYLRTANKEINAIASFFKEKEPGILNVIDDIYQESLLKEYFNVLYDKISKKVPVRIIRNRFNTKMSLIRDEKFIDIMLNLISSPYKFELREISNLQTNFVLIDKKTLILHEYTSTNQLNLTILTDPSLIKKFDNMFHEAWNRAIDIRLSWLTNTSSYIKNKVKKSFENTKLCISLPERGEMRIYDGIYLRNIVKYLLDITKKEVFIFFTTSTDFSQIIKSTSGIKNLTNLIIEYAWNLVEAVTRSGIEVRVITSYTGYFAKALTFKDVTKSLEIFPQYSLRFLSSQDQFNLIYGIYDNYLTFIIGEMTSSFFQVVVINDFNLRNHYLKQFYNTWEKSIDVRLVLSQYCSKRKKKAILKSLKEKKPEINYTIKEIQELFPKS